MSAISWKLHTIQILRAWDTIFQHIKDPNRSSTQSYSLLTFNRIFHKATNICPKIYHFLKLLSYVSLSAFYKLEQHFTFRSEVFPCRLILLPLVEPHLGVARKGSRSQSGKPSLSPLPALTNLLLELLRNNLATTNKWEKICCIIKIMLNSLVKHALKSCILSLSRIEGPCKMSWYSYCKITVEWVWLQD